MLFPIKNSKIIRPHRSCTTYVDATCCYWPSRLVCLSVGLSRSWVLQERLNRSKCPLGFGIGGTKEPRIRWGLDPTREGAILRGKGGPL